MAMMHFIQKKIKNDSQIILCDIKTKTKLAKSFPNTKLINYIYIYMKIKLKYQ